MKAAASKSINERKENGNNKSNFLKNDQSSSTGSGKQQQTGSDIFEWKRITEMLKHFVGNFDHAKDKEGEEEQEEREEDEYRRTRRWLTEESEEAVEKALKETVQEEEKRNEIWERIKKLRSELEESKKRTIVEVEMQSEVLLEGGRDVDFDERVGSDEEDVDAKDRLDEGVDEDDDDRESSLRVQTQQPRQPSSTEPPEDDPMQNLLTEKLKALGLVRSEGKRSTQNKEKQELDHEEDERGDKMVKFGESRAKSQKSKATTATATAAAAAASMKTSKKKKKKNQAEVDDDDEEEDDDVVDFLNAEAFLRKKTFFRNHQSVQDRAMLPGASLHGAVDSSHGANGTINVDDDVENAKSAVDFQRGFETYRRFKKMRRSQKVSKTSTANMDQVENSDFLEQFYIIR